METENLLGGRRRDRSRDKEKHQVTICYAGFIVSRGDFSGVYFQQVELMQGFCKGVGKMD